MADDRRTGASVAMIGSSAIAAGLAVYAFLRPIRVPLIPPALHFAPAESHPFAVLASLPSVIHAFAMPLLSVACLRRVRRRDIAITCLLWCAVDLVFEVGQRTGIRFFAGGTFDPLDLLGVLLGATMAGAVGVALLRGTR
jgi:hypothetical protein